MSSLGGRLRGRRRGLPVVTVIGAMLILLAWANAGSGIVNAQSDVVHDPASEKTASQEAELFGDWSMLRALLGMNDALEKLEYVAEMYVSVQRSDGAYDEFRGTVAYTPGNVAVQKAEPTTVSQYPLGTIPSPSPDLLLSNYEIRLVRIAEQAGRQAVVAMVEAKHPGRLSYEIWLDVAYGFMLKKVYLDAARDVVATAEYERIEFDPDLTDIEAKEDAVTGEDLWAPADRTEVEVRMAGTSLQFPTWLPEGFEPVAVLAREGLDKDSGGMLPRKRSHELWYSDGVASVGISMWLPLRPAPRVRKPNEFAISWVSEKPHANSILGMAAHDGGGLAPLQVIGNGVTLDELVRIGQSMVLGEVSVDWSGACRDGEAPERYCR